VARGEFEVPGTCYATLVVKPEAAYAVLTIAADTT
jgi:hypothetical protein